MSSETKTPCGFIDDGYTMNFDIPEVPGVSVGLSGMYRPMTQRERAKFFAAIDRNKYDAIVAGKTPAVRANQAQMVKPFEDVVDEVQCNAIARHLISWSLVDRNGESVELTAANVGRLYPSEIQSALVSVICGLYGDNRLVFDVTAVAMDASRPIADRLSEIGKLLAESVATKDETTDNEKN